MHLRMITAVYLLSASASIAADTVSYEFSIDYKTVNLTGTAVTALAIDDQIPAPTVRAAVGDTLRVTFHNRLEEVSTVHWHGILLPPDQDGVAYLNTQPILPGAAHTFEFAITHAGTYWYHSHTDLQIQKGLYGAVVLSEADSMAPLREEVVVLSDWTDEPVSAVLNKLKSADDYYSFQKDTLQSWNRVVSHGGEAIRNRLNNSLARMGPMDLADVRYDSFLVNGLPVGSITGIDASEAQMKLRLINGSTSSYFDVEYAGGPMTVVAADGQDIVPILVQRLRMSTAETYDVTVSLDPAYAYELRATSFDGTGYSSLIIGDGELVAAPDIPAPNLFLMTHDGDHSMSAVDVGSPDEHSHMVEPDPIEQEQVASQGSHADHEAQLANGQVDVIEHMTDYENLMSIDTTSLPGDGPWREISLSLTGTMNRYVWGFDNRTMRESPQVLIRAGENVRLHLTNDTMMPHPLHLHGHFFRVVNQHGELSPLKHTVNVPPMGQVTIEFEGNETQDWLFHCHNQFHMKSGMNRVVSYEGTSVLTPTMNRRIQPHQRWFDTQEFHLMSSFADYEYSLFDERHEFRFEVDMDLSDTYETHFLYAYHLGRFVSAFSGMETREHHHDDSHVKAIAGVNILLPLMIESEWRADDHGGFRLELESETALTRRVGIDWRWNTDNEYRYGVNFRLNSRWSMTVHTDSEYGDGIGIKFFY